jgi:hypothetical protein
VRGSSRNRLRDTAKRRSNAIRGRIDNRAPGDKKACARTRTRSRFTDRKPLGYHSSQSHVLDRRGHSAARISIQRVDHSDYGWSDRSMEGDDFAQVIPLGHSETEDGEFRL